MASDPIDPDLIFDGFNRDVLDSESSFEVLVRGYLWIDKVVSALIRAALPNADALTPEALDWMRFEHKIQLAQAQGTLQYSTPMRALNKVRNQLAHNPHTQIDASLVAELARSFDELDADGNKVEWSLARLDDALPLIDRLRAIMNAIFVYSAACTISAFELEDRLQPLRTDLLAALRSRSEEA